MNTDELDQLIDGALSSYASPEPRAGLPLRVMAHVRLEHGRSRRRWLAFVLAAAAMACVAIALTMWHGEPRPQPIIARVPSPPATPENPVITHLDTRHPPPARVRTPRRPHPRREQFPTPEPLTAEERSLLALAREAPATVDWLASADKPLEIEAIQIRPLQIDGLESGESK